MIKVCILDYGSGNVQSVKNLLQHLKVKSTISNKNKVIQDSTHIILPGVGAFGEAIKKLRKNIDINFLEKEVLKNKKPFLGICVGMQLLADTGEEFGIHKGLGWIKGKVIKLKSKILPHIGWNEIRIKNKNFIFQELHEKDFYFVNSFHFVVKNKKLVLANTEYKNTFCSVVNKENIYGVQFHPEKSQLSGKQIIKNFLSIK
jgi:imidazole glycerol-phosphate synthase subunit HisH